MHKSVGAIIKKEEKILMIDRSKFPFGWAGPAGHIEENETPEEALVREVEEETKLKVKKYKLLLDEFVEWNECSKGEKGHHWYLFEILEWEGEIKTSGEAKSMGWFSPEELKNIKLEEVWEYWFKKLNLI